MTRPLPLLLLLLAACSPAATAPDSGGVSGRRDADADADPDAQPDPDRVLRRPSHRPTRPGFHRHRAGRLVRALAALRGKPVVVYFYPKDETPGCTKEACSFRDAWAALAKTGAVLVGVSADSLDSHKAFARTRSSRSSS